MSRNVVATQWTLTVWVNGLKKRARYWGNHTKRLADERNKRDLKNARARERRAEARGVEKVGF